MLTGVVLDTSYLITLADKKRPNHEVARHYWRHFSENQMPIFLSTIVVAEFCVKQAIDPQLLRNCVVLPFNWEDAQLAAQLDWKSVRPASVPRDALKDDIKIIAQAAHAGAEYAITDDSDSFFPYCQRFREAGKVQFSAIKLDNGFDVAFFNGGQREFTSELSDADDPT